MNISKIRRIEFGIATFFFGVMILISIAPLTKNLNWVYRHRGSSPIQPNSEPYGLLPNGILPVFILCAVVYGCWWLLHYQIMPRWFEQKKYWKIAAGVLMIGILITAGVYGYLQLYKYLDFRYSYDATINYRAIVGLKVLRVFRLKTWAETTVALTAMVLLYETLSQLFYWAFSHLQTKSDSRAKLIYETSLLSWIGATLWIAALMVDRMSSVEFKNPHYGLILWGVGAWMLTCLLHSWAYYYLFLLKKGERKIVEWLLIIVIGTFVQTVLAFGEIRSFVPIFFFAWVPAAIAFFSAGIRYLITRPAVLVKNLSKNQAELSALRAQINPHFMFNAMNTLYSTAIAEKAEKTSQGIQQLSDMMRFMMHENNQDQIDVQQEVNYLRNYIDLQRLRITETDQLELKIDLDDALCLKNIAPMLLIPFVENAFKHGISLRHTSWIYIKLYCEEERLYFSVFNSLHPRHEDDPEKHSSGIGLVNVQKRLELLYPKNHQLKLHRTNKEFSVHLEIDFAKKRTSSKLNAIMATYDEL